MRYCRSCLGKSVNNVYLHTKHFMGLNQICQKPMLWWETESWLTKNRGIGEKRLRTYVLNGLLKFYTKNKKKIMRFTLLYLIPLLLLHSFYSGISANFR